MRFWEASRLVAMEITSRDKRRLCATHWSSAQGGSRCCSAGVVSGVVWQRRPASGPVTSRTRRNIAAPWREHCRESAERRVLLWLCCFGTQSGEIRIFRQGHEDTPLSFSPTLEIGQSLNDVQWPFQECQVFIVHTAEIRLSTVQLLHCTTWKVFS